MGCLVKYRYSLKLKKYLDSKSGFTIVELLVAVAIMGLVAMGVMNLNHFFQKETRSAYLRAEIGYFDRVISQVLAVGKNCEATINTTNPTIPSLGGGKAALLGIRSYNDPGIPDAQEKPVAFNVDLLYTDAGKLNKQLNEENIGTVSAVWIRAITIHSFRETDYEEVTTTKPGVINSNYNTVTGANRFGWALIEVTFAVRQRNGANADNSPRFFNRMVRAQYPVALVIRADNRLVKCVDASIRSAASALETLCVDLGGSVTFRDGEPECYGTLDTSIQAGRRTLCADFGGSTASREAKTGLNPSINERNYDCMQAPVMHQCDETRLYMTESMEFKCAE